MVGGQDGRVLVFGASGYIGRQLTPRLAATGRPVRAAARRPAALEVEGWTGVEAVAADALDPASLGPALRGVEVAYYLVHSMAAGDAFPELDRRAARNFAAAAAEAGVRRILYLGGLAPEGADSPHLQSRRETGEILRAGPVPVTELRAGIIVGPGSAAFEVMRDLVAHLPAMVTPRWIRAKSPPVALDDLLADMLALPWIEAAAGGIYETAGPEALSYDAMMRRLAAALGKRAPLILPVPVLTPRLSAYWLFLVTSVPYPVAKALILGLKHDFAADDRSLRALLPRAPIGFDEAVARTLAAEKAIEPRGRWREGAMEMRGGRHDVSFYGKAMTARATAAAPPEALWRAVTAFGTREAGHLATPLLWRMRLGLDRLFGGRTAPLREAAAAPAAGAAFGPWRALGVEPGRRLTLLSTLRAPGAGGMEFAVEPDGAGSRLTATIHWHPAGFKGLAYWFALAAPHRLALNALARAAARRAEAG